jgi:hypothetical protein
MSTSECDCASPSPVVNASYSSLLPNITSLFLKGKCIQNALTFPSEALDSTLTEDCGFLNFLECRTETNPNDFRSSVGLDLMKVEEFAPYRCVGRQVNVMPGLQDYTHSDASILRDILPAYLAKRATQVPKGAYHHDLDMANSSFLGRPMSKLYGKQGHTAEMKKKGDQRLGEERLDISSLDELVEEMIMRHINRSRYTELAMQSMYTTDCEDKQDQTARWCQAQVAIDFSNRKVERIQFVSPLEVHRSKGKPTEYTYLSTGIESMNQHDAVEINSKVLNYQVEQMITKHIKRRRSMEIITSSCVDVNRKRPSESELLQKHFNSDFGRGNNSLFLYRPSERVFERNLKQRKKFSL